MNDHTASFIEMPAASGQTDAFAEFLAGAAPLVAETEPGTKLWFALAGDYLQRFIIYNSHYLPH